MNLITPEGTAALHGANKGDRKVTNILHAMTSSGPIQRNTEDVIACKVPSLRMSRMKHCEVFCAEIIVSFNPVVLLICMGWENNG